MKDAVQLLTDRSIFVTYRLYLEDYSVVTLIIRPADDPPFANLQPVPKCSQLIARTT